MCFTDDLRLYLTICLIYQICYYTKFDEILHWRPFLEVVWELPLETMWELPLES